MKILWKPSYDERGNSYGYTTHAKNTKRALERRDDVEFVDKPEDADIAVDITLPTAFQYTPGVPNVLFTMYEANTIPDSWIDPVNKADLLMVPTAFNRHLFRKYRKGPIVECWEGMNPDRFHFHQREFPKDGPFIWLWVGASNPRKGYQHVGYGWDLLKDRHPEVWRNSMLIMKTTQVTKEERVVNHNNLRIDTRDYDIEDLVALYKMAHGFLFPTMGEGWGLTLHEALATGLPAIYTDWSAPVDWLPRKYGYPIKHRMMQIKAMNPDKKTVEHVSESASADVEDMVSKMARIYHHYDEALHKGKNASAYVRKLTWDASAEQFVTVLREFLAKEAAA
jgi:glycosyltransferase involved in cell wall biosynthesis